VERQGRASGPALRPERGRKGDNQMITDEELDRLRVVKATYEAELMRKANVVGVGIGLRQRGGEPTGEPVIVVSVTRKVPRRELVPDDVVPRELDGIPVDVQAVGELRAFQGGTGWTQS
jgi:hypothetical protein